MRHMPLFNSHSPKGVCLPPLQVNQKISKTAHIKELNAEIDRLKAELVATREKNGIYVPADQYVQREESSKANAVRLEMLEAEMEQQGAKGREEVARLNARISDLQEVASAPRCKPAMCGCVGHVVVCSAGCSVSIPASGGWGACWLSKPCECVLLCPVALPCRVLCLGWESPDGGGGAAGAE